MPKLKENPEYKGANTNIKYKSTSLDFFQNQYYCIIICLSSVPELFDFKHFSYWEYMGGARIGTGRIGTRLFIKNVQIETFILLHDSEIKFYVLHTLG